MVTGVPDLLGAHMSIAGGLFRARVPMALETPKEPEPKADRQALALLRSLRRR